MSRVIPCIDVMDGKVVQLVRGERKALELENASEALAMFAEFPLLHVIDLDAALGRPPNQQLVGVLLGQIRARAGGGVRSIERAVKLLDLGAEQVIVGTSAFTSTGVDHGFLEGLAQRIGPERVVVAIDIKGDCLAIRGWRATLSLHPSEVIVEVEPYCAGFLCTNVDREGMLAGTDLPLFLNLRSLTRRTLVAAGGITTMNEVQTLLDSDIDVALGMAAYTGRLSIDELAKMRHHIRSEPSQRMLEKPAKTSESGHEVE